MGDFNISIFSITITGAIIIGTFVFSGANRRCRWQVENGLPARYFRDGVTDG